MNKKYFETKTGSIEEKITQIATEQQSIKKPEPNVTLKVEKTYFDVKPGSISDVAAKIVSEGLDPVNKDAVKKKFDDRKDKDIDNDGDVDSSDKFLHKRRKAISKATSEKYENKRRSTQLIGPSKEHIKKLGLVRKGNVVYDKSGKYYGYVDKIYYMGKDTPFLHKVTGIEGKPFSQSAPVRKDQRPAGVKYQSSTDGMTGKKFAGEAVMPDDKGEKINQMKHQKTKEGEKEIVKLKEDDMAKFHQMQKDGKSAEQIAKALGLDLNSVKKLMDLDEARIIKSMLEQYFKKKVLDEKVGDDAKRMGLTYYKFGRYGKDGKITHTSKDGRLVSVPKKDQKSVSQAPKTTKTGPFSPIKGGGNFLGPKKTSKPREKKPESTPKAIQLSKTVEKQVEKIYDTDYNYKDKAKFEKDLSSVMKSIKDMADSDKAPGREYGLETINTFRRLSNLEDAVAQRRSEVKNDSKEDDVLADIQFKIRDLHDRPLTSPSKDKNAKSKIAPFD